jgi:hypothetical protein
MRDQLFKRHARLIAIFYLGILKIIEEPKCDSMSQNGSN